MVDKGQLSLATCLEILMLAVLILWYTYYFTPLNIFSLWYIICSFYSSHKTGLHLRNHDKSHWQCVPFIVLYTHRHHTAWLLFPPLSLGISSFITTASTTLSCWGRLPMSPFGPSLDNGFHTEHDVCLVH